MVSRNQRCSYVGPVSYRRSYYGFDPKGRGHSAKDDKREYSGNDDGAHYCMCHEGQLDVKDLSLAVQFQLASARWVGVVPRDLAMARPRSRYDPLWLEIGERRSANG